MKTALIDGDIIRYRIAHAMQKTHYKTDTGDVFVGKKAYNDFAKTVGYEPSIVETEVVVEPLHVCESTVHSFLANITDFLAPLQGSIIFLSGKTNFRNDIYSEYKANRKQEKPFYYDEVTRILVENYKTRISENMEADDEMAIFQSLYPNTIICSTDKDMKQVPGEHLNPVTMERFYITKEQAIKNFYTQLLTGDPTDNIPGIKGIGYVKAQKLLEGVDSEEDMYNICLEAWGNDKEGMEKSAHLLYLLRYPEDQWQPPIGTDQDLKQALQEN